MITYINTGTSPNAGNGDSLRLAFTKTNNNFREIANILGTGTSTISQVVTDKISQSFIHSNHVGITVTPINQQIVLAVNTSVNQLTIANALITDSLQLSSNVIQVGTDTVTVTSTGIDVNGNDIRAFNQDLNTNSNVIFNSVNVNAVYMGNSTLTANTSTLNLNGNTIRPVNQNLNTTDDVIFKTVSVSSSTLYLGTSTLTLNPTNLAVNGVTINGFDQSLNTTDSVIFNEITPTDETSNLGHPQARWYNLFLGTGTIILNDSVIQMTDNGQMVLNGVDIVNTSTLQIVNDIPTSSTSTGVVGQMAFNTTSLYMCVSTNTWLRFDGIIF